MKEHLILTLGSPQKMAEMPYWGDFLVDKTLKANQFIPSITGLFDKYRLPAWYTYEYKSSAKQWSKQEIKSGLDQVYRIILQQNGHIPKGLIEDIKLIPNIKSVRKVEVGITDIPNITTSQAITGITPANQILLPQAHHYTQGHPDIKIAVLDTGVDSNHPELAHAILPGIDFVNIIDGSNKFVGDYLGIDYEADDPVGHGTHVSGILVAKGLKMAKGVAPKCKIIPVRVLGALKKGNQLVGAGLIDNINNGIKWAVDHNADIINMSLGIKNTEGGLPHKEVINYALEKGVTIVAASGNDGTLESYYPGALAGVIAVGAVDQMDTVTGFSTFGKHVSFVAPGTNIVSAFPNNKYSLSSGTSQASPFVAGSIALLKSLALKSGKSLEDNQVKYILKNTCDKSGKRLKDIKSGYGRINLLDAFKLLNYKLNFMRN